MTPRHSPFLLSCLRHATRWAITLLLLMVLVYAAFVGVRFHHVDTRLYLWLATLAQPAIAAVPGSGRVLAQYTMTTKATEIAGVRRNLSGLAFDADKQQLIAVVNRPATLLRLSLDGTPQSTHKLLHAADIEGVAYLGHGRVAMVEEGRSRLLFAQLPDTTDSPLDLQQAFAVQISLDDPEQPGAFKGNKGFEGLGYDAHRDHLYLAKEHSPRSLYRISGIAQQERNGSTHIAIENLSQWVQQESVVGTDLSSVEVDPCQRPLLLLSDESQSVVELDLQGRFLGRVGLSSLLDPQTSVPQAEGVAIDDKGVLYVVSEPNLFYRLTPPTQH